LGVNLQIQLFLCIIEERLKIVLSAIGWVMMTTLPKLNAQLDHLSLEDVDRVRRALELAVSRLINKRRFDWAHIERGIAILDQWHMPADAFLVLVTYFLLCHNALDENEQLSLFGPAIRAQARTLLELHASKVSASDSDGARKAYRFGKLRSLFYQAYTSREMALLSLAFHQVRTDDLDGLDLAQARLLCEDNKDIYLPLTELFGLWALHRELADLCLKNLYPRQVEKIETQRELYGYKLQTDSEVVRSQISAELKRAGVQFTLKLHPSSDAGLYRRMERGVALPQSLRKLRYLVILPSEEDCYRALAHIHSLWLPLQGRGLEGGNFRDRIAMPKFNGYRSLITTVEYHSPFTNQILPVEFHLLTTEIDDVNNFGIIHACYLSRKPPVIRNAWWEDDELLAFVADRPLGTRSNLLYVFSPVGRAFSNLPARSVCLDYAYRIHTDLGNHCKYISVNGWPVSVTQELSNGDLVDVVSDPVLTEVRDEWLKAVKTTTAKKAIRGALALDAPARGRKILDDLLANELEAHGLKGFVSSEEIEQFLNKIAQRFKYPTLDALYLEFVPQKSALEKKHVSPNKIVGRFINNKLASQIARLDERPLGVDADHVRFAQCHHVGCPERIKPGVPIVGRFLRPDTPYTQLVVYSQGCPSVSGAKDASEPSLKTASSLVPLEWLGDRRPGEPVRVIIQAVDRFHLLGDLLNYVYPLASKGLSLLEVDAKVDRERKAIIRMTFDAPEFSPIDALLLSFESARTVGQLDHFQHQFLSPLEKRHLIEPEAIPNPYRTNATSDPRVFKGRDREISQILGALENDQRSITIHGLSRVGKSSLLRYLADYILPAKNYLPVYINLQGLTDKTEMGFWSETNQCLSKVMQDNRFNRVGEKKGARSPSDLHPYNRFIKLVDSAGDSFSGLKPVLLFDEINLLEELMTTKNESVHVINELKAIIESKLNIRCIFTMQALSYKRTVAKNRGLLTPMLRLGPELPLDHLDRMAAEKLIREPVRDALDHTPDLIQHLLQLSALHPYYLQNLLYWLLEKVCHDRLKVVDAMVLDEVIEERLLQDTNLFNHYLPEMNGLSWDVLICMAAAKERNPSSWVSVASLQGLFKERNYFTQEHSLMKEIDLLIDRGAVECRFEHSKPVYTIRVPLFQEWLVRFYPLDFLRPPRRRRS